jgi:hypothetical protein
VALRGDFISQISQKSFQAIWTLHVETHLNNKLRLICQIFFKAFLRSWELSADKPYNVLSQNSTKKFTRCDNVSLFFTKRSHLKSKPGELKCHLLCCIHLFPENILQFQSEYINRQSKTEEHNHLPLSEHKRYSVLFHESIKYVIQFLLRAILYIVSFISLWVKHIQKSNAQLMNSPVTITLCCMKMALSAIWITYLFCWNVKWSELRWNAWGQKYHVHWGDLILRVQGCVVTVWFGVYLVLWLL